MTTFHLITIQGDLTVTESALTPPKSAPTTDSTEDKGAGDDDIDETSLCMKIMINCASVQTTRVRPKA
jgi:hypothetical protein